MKLVKFAAVAIILLAVSAFAAESSKASLDVVQPIKIAGKTLQSGSYDVLIDRDGSNAKVVIKKGGKEVVNTTATVKEGPVTDRTAVLLDKDRNVQELMTKKVKGSIVFTPAAAPVEGGR